MKRIRFLPFIIKANAEYRHIPVILISANPERLVSCQKHGATVAVENPFNLPELLNLLQFVLQ